MRNKFGGPCYRCGQWVKKGEGHFERHKGGWRVQHASCAITERNKREQIKDQYNERIHDAIGSGDVPGMCSEA